MFFSALPELFAQPFAVSGDSLCCVCSSVNDFLLPFYRTRACSLSHTVCVCVLWLTVSHANCVSRRTRHAKNVCSWTGEEMRTNREAQSHKLNTRNAIQPKCEGKETIQNKRNRTSGRQRTEPNNSIFFLTHHLLCRHVRFYSFAHFLMNSQNSWATLRRIEWARRNLAGWRGNNINSPRKHSINYSFEKFGNAKVFFCRYFFPRWNRRSAQMIHIRGSQAQPIDCEFYFVQKSSEAHTTAPIGGATNGRSDENNHRERRRGDGAVAVRGNDEYVHRAQIDSLRARTLTSWHHRRTERTG